MSKGPGRIERSLEAIFSGNSDLTFSVDDLVPRVYPGVDRVEKKHRVSIIRAANKVVARLGWVGYRAGRPGGELIYWNQNSLRSYALGMLRYDFSNNGRSMARSNG